MTEWSSGLILVRLWRRPLRLFTACFFFVTIWDISKEALGLKKKVVELQFPHLENETKDWKFDSYHRQWDKRKWRRPDETPTKWVCTHDITLLAIQGLWWPPPPPPPQLVRKPFFRSQTTPAQIDRLGVASPSWQRICSLIRIAPQECRVGQPKPMMGTIRRAGSSSTWISCSGSIERSLAHRSSPLHVKKKSPIGKLFFSLKIRTQVSQRSVKTLPFSQRSSRKWKPAIFTVKSLFSAPALIYFNPCRTTGTKRRTAVKRGRRLIFERQIMDSRF